MTDTAQAGKLNRRIQIQIRSTTQNEFGEQLDTWTTEYACWAGINLQSARQTYSSGEFVDRDVFQLTLRYTSSFVFTPSQRVTYTDQSTHVTHTYQIEAVSNPSQANKTVQLLVSELDGAE